LIVVGVVLLQLSVNATQACLTAIVPDQVPLSQRATVSAFASFALPLGAVVGVAIIAQALHGARTAYYVLAGVLIVALALFVFLVPDPVLPKENVPAFDGKAFFSSFVRPLKSADFSLVLLGRVFVMFGYYIVVNYLLYYLEDAVGVKDPAVATSRVGMSQLLMTIILVASTIVTGIFSDRLQRRKPFVIGSAVIMAVSLLILALFPVLPMVFVAAAVLGLGFGGFLSGDLALQTQVLPARRDNGKDLGILNLGSLLPQILVPIVVGIALTFLHSYPVMFLIGAILAVLGGALIILVKSVR
jgi:MFS family permease